MRLTTRHGLPSALLALLLALHSTPAHAAETAGPAAPLAIGETFTIPSKVLGETRRINVYLPPGYAEAPAARFPVLYMPDGGIAEDFLHVAGLVQVSVGNGTMRPFVLVGIENTERRRDMTGPTQNAEDKKIAPRVGGSEAFRRFLREELMPQVRQRYRTTAETAIVGESLAGLFVIETFFLEPDLFDSYLAFDPSLWWNDEALTKAAAERLKARPGLKKELYFAGSRDMGALTQHLVDVLAAGAPAGLHWHYEAMPEETHATIYHPAALRAFRAVFAPAVEITAEPAHTLLLENDRVRVFRAALPPGGSTLPHQHRHDYVSITLGDSRVRNQVEGKDPVDLTLPDGETRFVAGGFAHQAKNLSDRPFANLIVELLQDAELRDKPSPWPAGAERSHEFSGGKIEVIALRDGVRISRVELQLGATVPSHHHDGPHLLVALSDLELRSDIEGRSPVTARFKAGEVKWLPGGYSHTLTNAGNSPARMVTVEFPN